MNALIQLVAQTERGKRVHDVLRFGLDVLVRGQIILLDGLALYAQRVQQERGGQASAILADGAVPKHGAILGSQHIVEELREAALALLVQHHALVHFLHDAGRVLLHGAQHFERLHHAALARDAECGGAQHRRIREPNAHQAVLWVGMLLALFFGAQVDNRAHLVVVKQHFEVAGGGMVERTRAQQARMLHVAPVVRGQASHVARVWQTLKHDAAAFFALEAFGRSNADSRGEIGGDSIQLGHGKSLSTTMMSAQPEAFCRR